MINFQQISIMRGRKVLFKDASFTLHDKHKVGLVGANGCGKTSLFALLLGTLEPAEGEISYQGNLKLAHVLQEIPNFAGTALEYALQGDTEYYQLNKAMELAEKNADYEKLADLHAEFATIDGYTAIARGAQLLSGLGFSEAAQQQPLSDFSGGWQMRLNLAQALMCRSDILLLDEPTNHLDLNAILWLERWLEQYPGLLVVISHDRDFLDRVINQVIHIEHGSIKLYAGNYSLFEKQRAEQMALQQATYEKQQKQIKHMTSFVDRFRYKASKAKQAQSRIKALERLKTVSAVQATSPFHFDFIKPEKCPYPLLRIDEVSLGYDDKTILTDIDWQLVPGDRVGLIGPNGAGKSTLIKSLTGKITPLKGIIEIDKGVTLGYFAQQQLEFLKPDKTAFEHLRILAPRETPLRLRNHLGQFGFSGDEVLKAIDNFSGGEKARLVLAMIVWQKPNLLLLDEPTNHLDMEMRMALTMALQSYEGALVVVSHDRYLIRNTVDHLWLVANGKLQAFNGDLDDYENWVFEHYRKQKGAAKAEKELEKPINMSAEKKKRANPVKLAALEKRIAELESTLKEISIKLNDSELYKKENEQKRSVLYEEQQRLQKELKKVEEEWFNYQ